MSFVDKYIKEMRESPEAMAIYTEQLWERRIALRGALVTYPGHHPLSA